MTDDSALASQNADQRPWGVWVSLSLYVVLFEVEWRVYDFALTATGVQPYLDRSYFLHSLSNVVAWGIDLAIILVAVRLTRIPTCNYLGWAAQPLLKKVVKPKAKWLRPKLLVEVEYRAMTGEGKLRHPSYKGLREDL